MDGWCSLFPETFVPTFNCFCSLSCNGVDGVGLLKFIFVFLAPLLTVEGVDEAGVR
jgi:hypothetical protein